MPSEKRLLTLLDSAHTTLGEAVELIITDPDMEHRYRDEARKLADLILRLRRVADDITAGDQQKSA